MKRAGIVYISGVDESQREVLAISRRHCSFHHPEVEQLLIHNRPPLTLENAADEPPVSPGLGRTTILVIDDESDPVTNASVKTRLNDVTPFDYSLFLAHDTLLTGRIDRIWSALEENSLAVAVDFYGRIGDALQAAINERSVTPQEADATVMLCGKDGLFFSTSVLLWKRSLTTDRFFEIWNQERRRFHGRDDFAFARALAKTGKTITVLPSKYNVPVVAETTEQDVRRANILHFRATPIVDHIRRLGLFPSNDADHPSVRVGDVAPEFEDRSKRHRLCIVCHNRDTYSETFVRAHIEHIPAEVSVFSGVWYPHPPDLPAKVARILIECGAEAVLAEFGPVGVATMGVCERLGLPLTVHFHGVDAYHQGMVDQLRRKYERLFQSAEAIVAVSKAMVQRLQDLKAPPNKIHYNPYGVDVSLFDGAKPGNAPPTFVAVGRFVDKKAPHLTILAFKDVLEQCREARLVMIGDGPLLESCRELVRAFALTKSVQFLGVCSPGKVADTLRSARAFVQHSMQTSYGDSEGTPVAILEAGATGLPVVASSHAGIPDIIIDEKTGFLVDEADVSAMTERMLLLARDADLAADMGAAARQRVTTQFSMDKSIEGLWRIIRSTLRTRATASTNSYA